MPEIQTEKPFRLSVLGEPGSTHAQLPPILPTEKTECVPRMGIWAALLPVPVLRPSGFAPLLPPASILFHLSLF